MESGSAPFTPSALIASSDSTPKGTHDYHEDIVMTCSENRRPAISSTLGLALDNVANTSMTMQPAPTAIPLSNSNFIPSQQPAADTLTFEEYMARNPIPAAVLQQVSQQQMSANNNISQSLFDAKEANFLTNFLQGFEGWDFNPNLPLDLPSFAEAERGAFGYGIPPSLPSGSEYRRTNSRKSTGGSKGKASPSASRIESNASAAFGRPMPEWNEVDEDGSKDERMRGKSTTNNNLTDVATGKKIKVEHGNDGSQTSSQAMVDAQAAAAAAAAASKRELLSDHEKRQNHILSEQRRRNHIREAFKELVDLLESGREFGARGLGLSSGAGTGIEDEGLDDRSDYESTLEDEEPTATAKRRKAKAKRRAAMEAILTSGGRMNNGTAATRGRGKGRGRGGSAGGGAGSKSAVLFQAVDLLRWLEGRNTVIAKQIHELEEAAPAVKAA